MPERRSYKDFRGDVIYDVWRSGGNPDIIDEDRVSEAYYAGEFDDEAAEVELRAQRRHHEETEEEE